MSSKMLLLCLAVGAALSRSAEGSSASACMSAYATGTSDGNTDDQKCAALAAFSDCAAGIPATDVLKDVVRQLERTNADALAVCNKVEKVQAAIKVVDRNIRVVSEKDIIFQRFRKDEIGIFELKKHIADTADALAKFETATKAQTDTLDNSVGGIGKRMDPLNKQLKDQQTAYAKIALTVQETFAKQDTTLRDLTAKTTNGLVDPLRREEIYWLALDPVLMPTDSPASVVHALGVGMAPYFHPRYPDMFSCTFTNTGTKKAFVSSGRVEAKDHASAVATFSIACATPEFVKARTVYTLGIKYNDVDGARTIAFKGTKGRNTLTFDMVWQRATFVGPAVLVDVAGFVANLKYMCSFQLSGPKGTKKEVEAAFVKGSKQVLSCGNQPTGFTVVGTVAPVTLKIFIKGTSRYAFYSGKETEVIQLPACQNGVLDGAETDVDCGGLCSIKCASAKKCKADSDCVFGSCSTAKKCGGFNGLGAETAGDSCKQIRRDYPKSKNGKYYVKGVGQTLKHSVLVFCWMEDREGGGWTMFMKNWYAGSRLGPWNFNGVGSPRSCDVLGIRGCAYKMHDDIIRAVIGQKLGQATKFDIMGDQAGVNTYYSAGNREWTILKDYTAPWKFIKYRPIVESRSKTTFRSYIMSGNFDGRTPVGDGKINWEAQLRCGVGGAGINCYGTRSHTAGYNANSRGGLGCKINPSRQRWSGNPHYYMFNTNHDTYVYICNGAQHSSGQNMNPRWWIRSGAGLEA